MNTKENTSGDSIYEFSNEEIRTTAVAPGERAEMSWVGGRGNSLGQ